MVKKISLRNIYDSIVLFHNNLFYFLFLFFYFFLILTCAFLQFIIKKELIGVIKTIFLFVFAKEGRISEILNFVFAVSSFNIKDSSKRLC